MGQRGRERQGSGEIQNICGVHGGRILGIRVGDYRVEIT